jgi:hypothetical protein
MTDLSRLLDVRFGLHSANDFLTMPGSLSAVQLVSGGESLMPRANTPIDRNDISAIDGRGFVHLIGPLDLADVSIGMEFKGVNANTGGAVADWSAKMEQANLLTSLFGAAGVATVGAAPTIAASGHGSAVLEVVGTTVVNGDFILFPTTTGTQMRQVVSGGTTTTLTLDRAYTGTPTTGATVIRGARWTLAQTLRNHLHGAFRAETGRQMSEFLGCAPVSATIGIPEGGKLTFGSTWSPTSGTMAQAPASPAFAAPTAGSPIVGLNTQLWIGGEQFVVRDASIAIATGNEPRVTSSSPHGRLGGIAGEKRGNGVVITGSLYFGDSSARGEVQRDTGTETLRTMLDAAASGNVESAARDVLLTVGAAAGRSLALRLNDADLVASVAPNGQPVMVSFTATATQNATLAVF